MQMDDRSDLAAPGFVPKLSPSPANCNLNRNATDLRLGTLLALRRYRSTALLVSLGTSDKRASSAEVPQ
jgi:hypothetical protein